MGTFKRINLLYLSLGQYNNPFQGKQRKTNKPVKETDAVCLHTDFGRRAPARHRDAPAFRLAGCTVTRTGAEISKKSRAHVNKTPLQVRNRSSGRLPSGLELAAKGPEPHFGEMEREQVMNIDFRSTAVFSARIGCSWSLWSILLPPAPTEQAAEWHPTCLARI